MGGKSQTLMFVNVSPKIEDLEETESTLSLLCFNQKDQFVNWARQERHVSQSFSCVVQL